MNVFHSSNAVWRMNLLFSQVFPESQGVLLMFIDGRSSFQMKIWLLGLIGLLCHKSWGYRWENEMANKYWKGQKPKRLKHMHPLPLDSHCQHLRVTVTVVLLLIFSTKTVFQFSCVVARVLREFASRTGSPGIFGFFTSVTTYLLKNTVTFQKPDFVLPWVQGNTKSPFCFFLGNRKTYKVLNWTTLMLSYGKNTETLWALNQENVHNRFPWKESDTRISPNSNLCKQATKGWIRYFMKKSMFYYILLWIWFVRVHILERYSRQNSSELSPHLPLHKIVQIFMQPPFIVLCEGK